MRFTSWIELFRQRLGQVSKRRRNRRAVRPQIESLEQRTLLSVAPVFAGGLLSVSSDADDAIVISTSGADNVLVNGSNEELGQVAAADVEEILIIGGPSGNNIDLSGVQLVDFSPDTGVTINGNNGPDTIAGSELDDQIAAGNGDDEVTGNVGADTIDLGDGHDSLAGDAGDDSLLGGDGNDTIMAGSGDNTVQAGDGDDSVIGGMGKETFDGGNGADTLITADGDDSLSGGMGSDSLSSGMGADFLNGQAGNDTLDSGDGDDQAFGGAGRDQMFGGNGDDSLNGQSGRDTIEGDEGDDRLLGALSSDTIHGGFGTDLINGGSQGDSLTGGLGFDRIFGGSGHDMIVGELGDDTLHGQGGNDTLIGQNGFDLLSGGLGNDFVQSDESGISVGDVTISPEGSLATFTVSLSTRTFQPVSVDFTTEDGTATAGEDYQATSGTLNFAIGETEKQVTVATLDDTESEIDETFRLNLSNATGAVIIDGQATGTIVDDDGMPGQPAETLFGVAPFSGTSNLHMVEPETGQTTQIGPTGVNTPIGLTADDSGTIYTIDAAGPGERTLHSIDPATGMATMEFGLGVSGILAEGALAFDSSSDEIFVTEGGTTNFYRIDVSAGTTNLLGNLTGPGGTPLPSGINIDGLTFRNSTLYGVVTDLGGSLNDHLVTIDTSTLEVTDVGPLGVDINFLAGLAWDQSQDVFFTSGLNNDNLFALDPATGNATLIGPTGLTDLSGLTFASVSGSGASTEPTFNEDELIVRFADPSNTTGNGNFVSDMNAEIKDDLPLIDGAVVELQDSEADIQQAATVWANHSEVVYAEPNYTISTQQTFPNDPRFSELYGMHNTGQTGGTPDADIDAPEAWDTFTGSSDVVLASIDTGVDYTHPDLADNMWRNPGEIPNDGIDNDGNGHVDDVFGIDTANDDSDPFDDNGHGTHTAGTMGAVGDNGLGVAGVNWDVQIMALKFLDGSGFGSLSDAIEAIDYMTMMKEEFGVNVVASNNSWGIRTSAEPQALRDAVEASTEAGIMFVAAAGNSAIDNDSNPFPAFPASFDLPGIISVAATDDDDQLAGFSNFGANSVDLGAPGVSVLSTVPTSGPVSDPSGFGTISGTSMASPHVAGAVGMLRALNPEAPLSQVKQTILQNVDPAADLAGMTVTGGRLNLARAMAAFPFPDMVGDTLLGGAGEDVLLGAGANDLITGNNGEDSIDGGAGNDSLFGGAGDDSITGSEGNDKIQPQIGLDTIHGEAANDRIIWNAGDAADRIFGAGGFDTLEIRTDTSNDDIQLLEGSPFQVTKTVLIDGVPTDIQVPVTPVTVSTGGETPSALVEQVLINSDKGDDQITAADSLADVEDLRTITTNTDGGQDTVDLSAVDPQIELAIDGGTGTDSLIGGAGPDLIQGGIGADTVEGRDGEDTLMGGFGVDNLFGNAGNDLIEGEEKRDFIWAGAGNDTVLGGLNDDVIHGDAGTDSLHGNEGNDEVFGGGGADTIAGNAGEDTLDGAAGDDNLSGGSEADTITAGAGNDTLNGSFGDDCLLAGAGDDVLNGDAGDDLLNGQSGVDTLRGGFNDDNLFGGGGADDIAGGADNDTLRGNAGADSLRGNDGEDFLIGDAGGDTLKGDNGNDRIRGGIGNDGLAGGDGFDTLNGQAADDTLLGNDGADVLRGGADLDILLGGNGEDNLDGQGHSGDTIAGGQGADTLEDNGGTDVIDEAFTFAVLPDWIDEV